MNGTGSHQTTGVPGLVLLITKDIVRAGRIAHALTRNGLVVTVAFEVEHAHACLADLGIEVIVADLTVFGEDPEEGVRRLRRLAEVPLLALVTSTGPHLEKVFRAGASAIAPVDGDDAALSAPVRGLLGLGDGITHLPSGRWRWGPIELDGGHRTVRVDGTEVAVTPVQLRLLAILMSARGDVVSHASLYRMLWRTPVDDGGQRLAAHVHRLRERLGAGTAGRLLLTVRGAGYRMADVPEVAVDEPVQIITLPELSLSSPAFI